MRRHDERPSNNREKIRAVTLPTMKDLNIEIFDKVLKHVKISFTWLLVERLCWMWTLQEYQHWQWQLHRRILLQKLPDWDEHHWRTSAATDSEQQSIQVLLEQAPTCKLDIDWSWRLSIKFYSETRVRLDYVTIQNRIFVLKSFSLGQVSLLWRFELNWMSGCWEKFLWVGCGWWWWYNSRIESLQVQDLEFWVWT